MSDEGQVLLQTFASETAAPPQLQAALATIIDAHLSRQVRLLALPTPVGWYGIAYHDGGLLLISGPQAGIEETYARLRAAVGDAIIQQTPRDDVGHRAAEALAAYHQGQRVAFDLPLDLSVVSPFTRDVLLATARIPYGEVRPYAWVASEAGHPKAVRAAGNALHRNPWAPIVPCHRVVASNNSLGGYAKGLEMKRWYLRLEGYLR
jgi:methylated-DNA-[protein]-cysteine S-methyltransferase